MKHTNQEDTSKNQGTADEHKKTNKSQQGPRNAAGDSGSQSAKGNREQNSKQGADGSWQKGKPGNRK